MSEFLLMYDDVRKSASPEDDLMEFLQSTYEAGANLAKWDRAALERKQGSGINFLLIAEIWQTRGLLTARARRGL